MKILFVDPYASTFFSFRLQLFTKLKNLGHHLVLVSENSQRFDEFRKINDFIPARCDLRNKSPLSNAKLANEYNKIIQEQKPDLILTFTIKPNLYCNVKNKSTLKIATITGLGSAFSSKWFLKKLVVNLSRNVYKKCDAVVFQNEHDRQVFEKNKIFVKHSIVVSGSGVDLERFSYAEPNQHEKLVFTYISRVVKEKGIGEFLDAASHFSGSDKVLFSIYGQIVDVAYKKRIDEMNAKKVLSYHCFCENPESVYRSSDFIVLPSYYNEGISNVLLESCATGRPILTCSSTPGCGAVLVDQKNGFSVEARDSASLIQAVQRCLALTFLDRQKMGLFARAFVEKNFSRSAVVNQYVDLIDSCKK
jgi:glycosyltransferase involved in cell wall biosynthesis